jgi:septal ring factor EnvC (AmiA/AmiB activator)
LRERELARSDADELAWRELLHDQLRSFRTGLVVLGVLAVAALGIALWALLTVQSSGDVSAARVRRLERRVDRIQTEVRSTPSSATLASLQASQQSLDKQVSSLASRLQRVEQASVEVKATLSSLQQRVGALERQTPTPTPTPTP